ncbi:MAG TPA: DUF4349 domain-containing protein [Solirubrobacterales bacterium]|jgi:hypothetical protein|nr:DUF4349 domain-containing protein [Solirubrobacterales bacterium]
MEPRRDDLDLAAELRALRPSPERTFAAALDARAAAGFPRRTHADYSPISSLAARLRRLGPRRLLYAAGATALASIAIATVVVATNNSAPEPVALDSRQGVERPHHVQFSGSIPKTANGPTESSAGSSAQGDTSAPQFSTEVPPSEASADLARGRVPHRDIKRSTEIGLLAEPADVADDSADVFSAVHNVGGIVLHSTTTAGRNTGANFDLLIPSAKLGDALAAFSAIDEVRTRHEATTDITAPTVAIGERLQDSRAKIAGLLSQLSAAETASESEAIEIELRDAHRHAAALRSQLAGLHRRVDYSRVSLRIESGAAAPSGSWGIDDAWGDAGHILVIAAGVTLVGLAVLAPLALLYLLAWLAYRFWLRIRREQALDA